MIRAQAALSASCTPQHRQSSLPAAPTAAWGRCQRPAGRHSVPLPAGQRGRSLCARRQPAGAAASKVVVAASSGSLQPGQPLEEPDEQPSPPPPPHGWRRVFARPVRTLPLQPDRPTLAHAAGRSRCLCTRHTRPSLPAHLPGLPRAQAAALAAAYRLLAKVVLTDPPDDRPQVPLAGSLEAQFDAQRRGFGVRCGACGRHLKWRSSASPLPAGTGRRHCASGCLCLRTPILGGRCCLPGRRRPAG